MEYGNSDFNNGLKKSIYAYHIYKVYMLEKPIDLITLKKDYNFFPPQKYIYLKNNIKLKEYLWNMDLEEVQKYKANLMTYCSLRLKTCNYIFNLLNKKKQVKTIANNIKLQYNNYVNKEKKEKKSIKFYG